MIKVVIFDVMGVIFKVGDDTNDLLIPYIQSIKKCPAEKLRKLYHEASLGIISPRDFWAQAGFEDGEIQAVQDRYLNNHLTFDNEFTACASKLKSRYTLAILSNDIAEWSAFLRRKHNIDAFIPDECAFISSDLRLRKPDPEMYAKALSSLAVQAHECVFIDDSPERVDAASKLGITAMLFNREGYMYNGLQMRSFGDISHILL